MLALNVSCMALSHDNSFGILVYFNQMMKPMFSSLPDLLQSVERTIWSLDCCKAVIVVYYRMPG